MSNRTMTLLAGLAAASLVACGGAPKRGHTLIEDVRTYNEGVRWSKWAQAATTLPLPEREDFMDEREDLAEDLRIVDYEIKRIRFRQDRSLARVDVEFVWHLDSVGIVRTTVARQNWERRGKFWILTDEVRARGEPMPGLPEPPEDDKADEEADEDDESVARSTGTEAEITE